MGIGNFVRRVKDALAAQEEESAPDRKVTAIRLATAAVLLEVAHADSKLEKAEVDRIIDHLEKTFGLGEAETRELMDAAEEIRARSIDHWHLTNVIRTNTTLAARIEIVKTMFRIVWSDGFFHQYEDYLVRKLSDLLGVEHHVMIEAKLAVKEELGRREE